MYAILKWNFVQKVYFGFRFWILLEHPKNYESASDSNSLDHSLSDKLSYIPALIKFMIPLGLVYFFEYLINQGLVSTKIIRINRFSIWFNHIYFQFELVYFEKIWLSHAEQYRWYQVLYQLGVFTSRTLVNQFPIETIWIFTILQVCENDVLSAWFFFRVCFNNFLKCLANVLKFVRPIEYHEYY